MNAMQIAWWRGTFLLALACLAGLAGAQVDLIVRLKNRFDAQTMARKYRVQLLDRVPGAPFALYRARSAAEADRVVRSMQLDPRIVWVEEDDEYTSPEGQGLKGTPYKGSILPAVGDRTVLYRGNANALAQINFSQEQAAESGRIVRVAVIDTGLSPSQAYLWSKVDYAINLIENEYPYDIERQTDSNGDGVMDGAVGHGTMVAGVIDQLAPMSRFTIVRAADSDGNSTAWRLVKALAVAANTNCEVANVSLGSLNQLPAIGDIIDWCDERRLLVVAAMGNDGVRRAASPARVSDVIAVGGLLPDNRKAPFSNYEGKCDFSAPATGIISQWHDGRIGEWSGTSFAVPMVVGAIADALKGTSRLHPSILRARIDKVGGDLDRINPEYEGELGVLLDVMRLRTAIRRTSP